MRNLIFFLRGRITLKLNMLITWVRGENLVIEHLFKLVKLFVLTIKVRKKKKV